MMELALAALALTMGGAPSEGRFAADVARLTHPDGYVMVVSHRSCWTHASENSVEGVEACVALGVDMVEVDVRRTRDGALVLMHDETVDRMTDGHGAVADLTLAQVQTLRLRDHAGRPGDGLTSRRVPTLDAFMRAAKGRILVNLDNKAGVYAETAEVLRRTGTENQALENREGAVDDPQLAQRWRTAQPFQPVVVSSHIKVDPAAYIAAYAPLHVAGVQIISTDEVFWRKAIQAAHALGGHVFVNTMGRDIQRGTAMNISPPAYVDDKAVVDPGAVWGVLIEQGCDVIQTDRPEDLLAFLARRPPLSRD